MIAQSQAEIAQSQAQIGRENQENVNRGNSSQENIAEPSQHYTPVPNPIRPNVRRQLF